MEVKVGDVVITEGYSKRYDGKPLTIRKIDRGYCYFLESEEYHHNFHIRDIKSMASENCNYLMLRP